MRLTGVMLYVRQIRIIQLTNSPATRFPWQKFSKFTWQLSFHVVSLPKETL